LIGLVILVQIVSFNVSAHGKDYNFDVITEGQGRLSGYAIIPDKQDELAIVQELFKQAKVEESLTMGELAERLNALPEVSHLETKVDQLFQQLVQMVGADLEEIVHEFLPHTKEGAIDLANLKKIGGGGTQDVYALEDKPRRFVLKVNRESKEMEPEERLNKYSVDSEAYRKLHDSFGDHCIAEKLFLRNVDDGSGMKQAIISIADYEKGFKDESKIALNADDFGTPLTIARNPKGYERMLKSLFFSDEEYSFNEDLLEDIQIIDLITRDPEFRESVTDFLIRFEKYFENTGQYLDIKGHDNIIFFRDDGKWTFKLGTVVKELTRDWFKDSLSWFKQGAPECDNWDRRMELLGYCIKWTVTLNTLGMVLGLGRIIDDENVKHVADHWEGLREKIISIPKRPGRIAEIGEAVKNNSLESLGKRLDSLNLNLAEDEETDSLLDVLSSVPPAQKVALANYLHAKLPRASAIPPNYEFCSFRYQMAGRLMEVDEGKELALKLYSDVDLDKDAPHEELRQTMAKLKEFLKGSSKRLGD